MSNSKVIQFELWQECNNLCEFCYLGKENRKTDDVYKILSLKNALKQISDETFMKPYDIVGFIGGEFFQGQLRNPEVKQAFMELMRYTANLYNTKRLKQVWFSATLTIGSQSDLYEVLELFDDLSNVWVLTSYDTIGRFKTEKMLNNWDFHMKKLKTLYPEIKLNITTILTDDTITKYLNKELSFKDMMTMYDATFFFKQCSPILQTKGSSTHEEQMIVKKLSNELLPNFFPTRKKFLKFLCVFKEQESFDCWSRLFNIQFRADNLLRNFNDGHQELHYRFKDKACEVDDSVPMECGHPFVYSAYIDSNACVLCDKQKLS